MNAVARHAPYREEAANQVYHLLFADDPAAFAESSGAPANWRALYGDAPEIDAMRAIAKSAAIDARFRIRACRWLDAHGHTLTVKELLGVVVEVALDTGLDTLAAYADGGVRYINHTGAMSFFEGRNDALSPAVDALFAASREVVARIGPWNKPRLAPPSQGRTRLSFLVTDGLYFGEGPTEVFQRDATAGPVVAAATALLVKVVEMTRKR